MSELTATGALLTVSVVLTLRETFFALVSGTVAVVALFAAVYCAMSGDATCVTVAVELMWCVVRVAAVAIVASTVVTRRGVGMRTLLRTLSIRATVRRLVARFLAVVAYT